MNRVLFRSVLLLLGLTQGAWQVLAQADTLRPLQDSVICGSVNEVLWWADDFEGTALDTQRWTTYYPYGPGASDSCSFCRTHSTADHDEMQVFLDRNVAVAQGRLSLSTRRERATWFEFEERHTSGMIYSREMVPPFFRAEARMRVPTPKGLWPAFWMFGGSTEIDVFEFYGNKRGRQPSLQRYEISVHDWSGGHTAWHDTWVEVPTVSDSFHVYGVDYRPEAMTFTLDGVAVAELRKFRLRDGSAYAGCVLRAGEAYLVHDQYPAPGDAVAVIVGTGVRRRLRGEAPVVEVDWVRVWRGSSSN